MPLNEALRRCRKRRTVLCPFRFSESPRRGAEASPHKRRNGSWSCSWPREDFAHLEAACLVFGIGKSELVRRLIRASVDIGPALSLEDGKKLAPIGKELRAIGRNIAQIVKGINLGYAPQLTDSEELFRTVYLTLAQMNATIQTMIVAYGSRLRRGAGLKALADKEPA